jgi:hypothetical protein
MRCSPADSVYFTEAQKTHCQTENWQKLTVDFTDSSSLVQHDVGGTVCTMLNIFTSAHPLGIARKR